MPPSMETYQPVVWSRRDIMLKSSDRVIEEGDALDQLAEMRRARGKSEIAKPNYKTSGALNLSFGDKTHSVSKVLRSKN